MIENGGTTIGNATVIIDVDGEGSSATIQDRTQAVGDGLDDDVEIGNPAGLTTSDSALSNQRVIWGLDRQDDPTGV